MSFCTKGLPGVAESTVSKSDRKPSPWGEGVRIRADEGGGKKEIFPEPYPASMKVSNVPEDEGYSWDDGFCDFAIRLRAE